MAVRQQKSEQTTLTKIASAGSIIKSPVTASVSAIDSSQDKSHAPSTNLGTATELAQPQDASITPSSSQTSLNNSRSSIGAVTGSSSPNASESSHHWHAVHVGTVVSETEVPKAWASKFLEAERVRQEIFVGSMALVFVVTMIGIVGIGWWR
jgi:hypothetical protein